MSEVIIAAIAAGIGAVLAALGTMIVNIVKAKNEPKMKELELGTQFRTSIEQITNQIKSFQVELEEKFEDISDKLDNFRTEQSSYNVAMIRHDIVQVYEFYKDSKSMPLPVYQSVLDLFDKYEKLGGNSFVHQLIEEMKTWDKE